MVAPGDAFLQYFWGEKNAGYDVLLNNMKQGVTATKELHEILRERANYEEAFSKSLQKLSLRASTITTVGSFYPIWLVINDYIEKMSKIHGKFADRFRELCTELNQYLDMTAKTNKSNRENEDVVKTAAALVAVRNALNEVNKCKKYYQTKHKELVESEEALSKAGQATATDKTEKETEKLQQKCTRCQDSFTVAENNYKSSVDKYNKAQEEYQRNMQLSCKFFGEVEESHLNSIVNFARKFGEEETELVRQLQLNVEEIMGGICGYTPEYLIEKFVEEKQTGIEMAPLMTPELLTTKDLPISPTQRSLDKSSDSGSVNSLPNNTTISMASVSQHMTLKAFKGMLKKSKNKKKINEGDTKSVDSKTSHEGSDNNDNLSLGGVSQTSKEVDEQYSHQIASLSSDDDYPDEDDSSDDNLPISKLKNLEININKELSEQPTEDMLRDATATLTLSPSVCVRSRATTYNHQLFSDTLYTPGEEVDDQPLTLKLHSTNPFHRSLKEPKSREPYIRDKRYSTIGYTPNHTPPVFRRDTPPVSLPRTPSPIMMQAIASPTTPTNPMTPRTPTPNNPMGHSSSLADLAASPEVQPKNQFPTTFDTPRAKSVSGNLNSPRSSPRRFSARPAPAVPVAPTTDDPWAVFDDSFKGESGETLDSWNTTTPTNLTRENLATSSESPISASNVSRSLFADLKIPDNEEPILDFMPLDAPLQPTLSDVVSDKRRITPTTIEDLLSITREEDREGASPNSDYQTPASSIASPESLDVDIAELEQDAKKQGKLNSLIEFSPVKIGTITSHIEPESKDNDSGDLTPRVNADGTIDQLGKTDSTHSVENGPISNGAHPRKSDEIQSLEDSKLLSAGNEMWDNMVRSSSADNVSRGYSTEHVTFNASTHSSLDDIRGGPMVYPVALALVETANAVFKPDNRCTAKVEGALTMSLPRAAAQHLTSNPTPPALKLKLSPLIIPQSFIINRKVISLKPPSMEQTIELDMRLLQTFIKEELSNSAQSARVNIPLLKYELPVMGDEIAPLIARSSYTTCEDQITISVELCINDKFAKSNFYFPRIVLQNAINGKPTTIQSKPQVQWNSSAGVLKWEKVDVGKELLHNKDISQARYTPTCDSSPTNTNIEFELSGEVLSGTDVCLDVLDGGYSMHTVVKKVRSGKYWTEPAIIEEVPS